MCEYICKRIQPQYILLHEALLYEFIYRDGVSATSRSAAGLQREFNVIHNFDFIVVFIVVRCMY